MENTRVVLASRPKGWVTEDNFRIERLPVAPPREGEVLVKNLWLSLDPYMRGRMSDAKSYVKGVDIGEVMVGQTVGEVLESKNTGFKPGDKVLTQLGWQLFGVAKDVVKLKDLQVPLSYYLGILGMPGMTAYFGLKEIGQPKAGETLVVSAGLGLPSWWSPYQAVTPGIPTGPRYTDSGSFRVSTLARPEPSDRWNSCQPPRPRTVSPKSK